MENRLEKAVVTPISLCDNHGRMSMAGLLGQFMDLASEHGAAIGLGGDVLAAKGLIWLVARTKLMVYRMPGMLEPVAAATWPEPPGRIRCHRFYTLTKGSELLAEGKNEWAMLEVATGRFYRIADAYPAELRHRPETACAAPFARLEEDFSGCPELAKYVVRSTDIDTSQHMNNVAYLRALYGALSCERRDALPANELDIAYRVQCFEGEELSIRLREDGNAVEAGIIKRDGRAAAVIRIG